MTAFIQAAVQTACSRIAPTWPLDRFIAVNPFWGFTHLPFQQASSLLQRLCGSSLLPESFRNPEATPAALPLCLDSLSPENREAMVQSLSLCCAAFFDQGQAGWRPSRSQGLYAFWRSQCAHDYVFGKLFGARAHEDLPDDSVEMIRRVILAFEFERPGLEHYLTALLLSLNGWAAWCAYQGWQARLSGQEDDSLEQLLAMRLAWEWLIYKSSAIHPGRRSAWLSRVKLDALSLESSAPESGWNQLDQHELRFQQSVSRQLNTLAAAEGPPPRLQAVFCIDVRSEPLRRALESCDPHIQTLGYAGFFGIPADYTPLGTQATRPQLPGLLAPSLSIQDQAAAASSLAGRRGRRLSLERDCQTMPGEALASFHWVESLGLSYVWKLLRATFAWESSPPPDQAGLTQKESEQIQPGLTGIDLGRSITLASSVLRGMSLTHNFAPTVLLIGHASTSRNNPHAGGLDCGACCGQSGQVNSRALAGLLNDAQVRLGLAGQGLRIPPETRFVAGLHDTTSDEITLFQGDGLDPIISSWLRRASELCRQERAPALGLNSKSPAALAAACRSRGRDWSQVRPEWGLANNAGFLAAPRARSREANLAGRCFLHEYRAELDPDGSILEQIMTAPMIVAHWINMQYYASAVDNRRWGSGNKVLHNVVGGTIGVFEGNGGDLRIGLALQSLHDGQRWMHEPLRLSVWLEAPQDSIERVLSRHQKVAELVHGGWIHLLRIEPKNGESYRYDCRGASPRWERLGVEPAQPPEARTDPVHEGLAQVFPNGCP
ncbi:DUF2309 domain-containing protein [bacterium]|nr:DUF2309 domain-containing protein [bacterium]